MLDRQGKTWYNINATQESVKMLPLLPCPDFLTFAGWGFFCFQNGRLKTSTFGANRVMFQSIVKESGPSSFLFFPRVL